MRFISRKINKLTAKLLDLPHDVVFDLPRITMIGQHQLYIENHRGVIQFQSDLLRLALTKGVMEVRGTELVLRAILTEEVFVEGHIISLHYLNPQG
jgi:sporulation protein YqfC